MGVGRRVREDLLHHTLRPFPGPLVLFLHDLDAHAGTYRSSLFWIRTGIHDKKIISGE
jgi:hypothetical protein